MNWLTRQLSLVIRLKPLISPAKPMRADHIPWVGPGIAAKSLVKGYRLQSSLFIFFDADVAHCMYITCRNLGAFHIFFHNGLSFEKFVQISNRFHCCISRDEIFETTC